MNNESQGARKKAHEISRIAMWDTLVQHYFTAYENALDTAAKEERNPGNSHGLLKPPGYNQKTSPDTGLERYLCSERCA